MEVARSELKEDVEYVGTLGLFPRTASKARWFECSLGSFEVDVQLTGAE